MEEQPRYVPIVREPDLPRIAAATRAVLAEFERLRELAGHRPEILARLYAGRALAADDDHGRAHDLVVQADELRWAELEHLVRLAETRLEPGQHADVGTWHEDCSDCQAVLAIGRIRARHRYRTISPHHPPHQPPHHPPGRSPREPPRGSPRRS